MQTLFQILQQFWNFHPPIFISLQILPNQNFYTNVIIQLLKKKFFQNSQLLSCVENVATTLLLVSVRRNVLERTVYTENRRIVKANCIHWRAWNNRVIKKRARTISLYRAWVSSIKVLGRFYRRILGRDPSIQLFDYFSSASLAAA